MTIEHDKALPTLADPDNDPWIWLEDVDGERATKWVDEQSARTLKTFSGDGFERDRADLLAIMDNPHKLLGITRRGAWIYNYWIDAENPRGLWRRCSLESYRTENPDWDVIIDLDTIAREEDEDWVWHGAATLPGSHDRALLSLSRGGGDAVVIREFDVDARSFVASGFALPEAKTSVDWVDRDTVLVGSALGEGMATTSGYARTIRLWHRGDDFTNAKTVFEIGEENLAASVSICSGHGARQIFYRDQIDFYKEDMWIGDLTGASQRLDLPEDWEKTTDGRSLILKPRNDSQNGDQSFKADTVIAIDLQAAANGERMFETLFEPTDTHITEGSFWLQPDVLMVATLDELRPRQMIWRRDQDTWRSETIEGLPDFGTCYVWGLDTEIEEANGDLLAVAQDPLTPPKQLLIERGNPPAELKQGPSYFSTEGLAISRHDAISEDGTKVPYFQIGPKDAAPDAPLHLYAYGGFGISTIPYYNSQLGKAWLENGGTGVIACIRGGGEYGTRWHDAGRLEVKHRSHDDFAAVAADLVSRGVTTPKRIAAEGGSNGGLLIANMLTRYPERFGALFCTIPLIDMRRYTKLLAGASWMAEYGDPDDPDSWNYIQKFSAYHCAESSKDYPPILLATARKDDRVHPGHARKMAAKLQALGHEAWLYEPAAGGHGYGKDNKERATFTALGYAFMKEKIGWT